MSPAAFHGGDRGRHDLVHPDEHRRRRGSQRNEGIDGSNRREPAPDPLLGEVGDDRVGDPGAGRATLVDHDDRPDIGGVRADGIGW